MTARVLVVCTANICRSPTAAGLLAARLGPGVEVVSRGVAAPEGAPMCSVSANWMMQHGARTSHASRRLAAADVGAATLVLTASGRQRDAVVDLRPAALARTFLLAEAARLARWRVEAGASPPSADPAERVRWMTEEMAAHRGSAPPPRTPDDIPDPHRGAPHAEVLPHLVAAVDRFALALGA